MLMYYLLVAASTIPYHWFLTIRIADLTVTKWIGLLSLLVAMVHFPLRRQTGYPARAATAAFFAYLGVMMFSSLTRGSGISLNQDFAKVLSILALYAVVQIMTDTEEKFRRVVAVVLLAVAYASNYVVRQFFHNYGLYSDPRTGGPAGDANYYAAMIVIWLPCCFVLLIGATRAGWRVFYAACALASLVGFMLASSRGGLLGMAAGSMFLISRSRHRVRLALLMIVLVVPPMLVMPASPIRRLMNPTSGDTRSSDYRKQLWAAAAGLFLDHPVIGAGTTNFKEKLQQYQDPRFRLEFTAVHNTYLECAATWGIAGLIPFLSMMVLLFRALGRVARAEPVTPLTRLAAPLQAGLIGYAVAAVFLSTWWFMMYWLLISLSFAVVRLAGVERRAPLYSGTAPAPAVLSHQVGN